ncbi:MAG: rod shape-determining protein MreC [Verrucomicrobia bacterium]|nr:rod shape-determining protein MreC [Verrucomicrobiota bacterium]
MFEQKIFFKWGAAAIALLLLFSLPDGCTARVKGLFKEVLTPIQGFFLKGGNSLKAGVDSVRGFGGLAEENRLLNEAVVKLQAESRVRDTLEEENLRLRGLLEFRNQQSIELIPAQVVTRSISGWWQSLGLGKGTSSGIRANHAVISPDGLVGRTAGVSPHSAEVLLVSDPACNVSARISRTGSFGLVVGRGVNLKGYPVAQMRFIHKDTPVRVGDEVVTSGLGGVFPRDILIGYVEEIHTEEAGLYQVAELLPQAVVNLTDVVFVTADEGTLK